MPNADNADNAADDVQESYETEGLGGDSAIEKTAAHLEEIVGRARLIVDVLLYLRAVCKKKNCDFSGDYWRQSLQECFNYPDLPALPDGLLLAIGTHLHHGTMQRQEAIAIVEDLRVSGCLLPAEYEVLSEALALDQPLALLLTRLSAS